MKETWEFNKLTKNSLSTNSKKSEFYVVEIQLHANAREYVFEKMPFLTLANKNEVCDVKMPFFQK